MDIFNEVLAGRADAAEEQAARRQLNKVDVVETDPAARLIKFDAWVRAELGKRLDWSWAGAQRERRIEQCRLCLEKLVLDLWRRGWMLDGKKLARHIEAVLDAVARQQKAGKVQDFWAYFQASVNRYVGANAEELREEAMRAGTHVSQLLSFYGVKPGTAAPVAPSLPELIAQRASEVAQAKEETLREKIAKARKRPAADDGQASLL
jgi:hypothetical protein